MNSGFGSFSAKRAEVPEQFSKWRDTESPEAYNDLIKYLGPTISSGMTSFGNKDLKVKGRILVDKALRSYDDSKGASLKSHIYNNLKGLQRVRADRQTALHIPESVRLNRMHVNKFEQDHFDETGIVPSDETIADALRISKKAVAKTRLTPEMGQLMNDKGDSAVNKKRSAASIWQDYVYHDVDDVNKKIMQWALGYGGAKKISKKEMAQKLGVSPAAISSRIDTISRKLEQGLDDGTYGLL